MVLLTCTKCCSEVICHDRLCVCVAPLATVPPLLRRNPLFALSNSWRLCIGALLRAESRCALACCMASLCTLPPYRTNTHLLYSFLADRGMLSNRLPPCPPSSSWLQPPLPRHCSSSAARRAILLSTSCGSPSAVNCPATPPLTLRDSWRAIL